MHRVSNSHLYPGLINARLEVRATDTNSFVQLSVYKDIKSNEEIKEIDIELSCSLGILCESMSLIISCQLLLKIQCDDQANKDIFQDYFYLIKVG